jgi:hypothetical protein
MRFMKNSHQSLTRFFVLSIACISLLCVGGCFSDDFGQAIGQAMMAQILTAKVDWCSGGPAAAPQLMMVALNNGPSEPNGVKIEYVAVYCDGEVVYGVTTDGNDVHYLQKRLAYRELEFVKLHLQNPVRPYTGTKYSLSQLMPIAPFYQCSGMEAFICDYGLSLAPDGSPVSAASLQEYELPAWVLQAQGYNLVGGEPAAQPSMQGTMQHNLDQIMRGH